MCTFFFTFYVTYAAVMGFSLHFERLTCLHSYTGARDDVRVEAGQTLVMSIVVLGTFSLFVVDPVSLVGEVVWPLSLLLKKRILVLLFLTHNRWWSWWIEVKWMIGSEWAESESVWVKGETLCCQPSNIMFVWQLTLNSKNTFFLYLPSTKETGMPFNVCSFANMKVENHSHFLFLIQNSLHAIQWLEFAVLSLFPIWFLLLYSTFWVSCSLPRWPSLERRGRDSVCREKLVGTTFDVSFGMSLSLSFSPVRQAFPLVTFSPPRIPLIPHLIPWFSRGRRASCFSCFFFWHSMSIVPGIEDTAKFLQLASVTTTTSWKSGNVNPVPANNKTLSLSSHYFSSVLQSLAFHDSCLVVSCPLTNGRKYDIQKENKRKG